MSAPNSESLKALFQRKQLQNLAEELDHQTTTFEEFFARKEEQWERRYGDAGVDIFNHLHSQQGNLIKPASP